MSFRNTGEESQGQRAFEGGHITKEAHHSLDSDPQKQQSWWMFFTRRQPARSGSPSQQSFTASITWSTVGRMSLDLALSCVTFVSLRGLGRQMSVSNPLNVLISLQSLLWSLFLGPSLSLTPSLY